MFDILIYLARRQDPDLRDSFETLLLGRAEEHQGRGGRAIIARPGLVRPVSK